MRKYMFRCWYNAGLARQYSFPVYATSFAEAIKLSIPEAEEEGFALNDLYQVRRDDGKKYLKDELKTIVEAITKDILES